VVRQRTVDHDKVIELMDSGLTYAEIAEIVGAKNRYTVRTIIRKYKTEHGLRTPRLKPTPGTQADAVPLDVGKVKALTRAGWDLAKICDEFNDHYSPDEIREAMMDGWMR